MFRHQRFYSWSWLLVGFLPSLVLIEEKAGAQLFLLDNQPLWQKPVVGPLVEGGVGTSATLAPSSPSRDTRFRLFRMPSGFLTNPVTPPEESTAETADPAFPSYLESSEGDLRIQVAAGVDNPYFDFRTPGDPGGLGYYRVQGQWQLAATQTSGLSLAVQAVMPAGVEWEGLPNGPTILNPAVAWSWEVFEGSALHAFLSKEVRAGAGWTNNLDRSLQYGFALQSPLGSPTVKSGPSLFMFIEALGRQRVEDVQGRGLPAWQLLPGIHWRLGESSWLSGGLILPLREQRVEPGFWQITCSWRF